MQKYPLDAEVILSTLTSLYLNENKAREAALLSQSRADIEFSHEDNWNGGTRMYDFRLHIPTQLFGVERGNIEDFKSNVREHILCITEHLEFDYIRNVFLIPDMASVSLNWRANAQQVLSGAGTNNQVVV